MKKFITQIFMMLGIMALVSPASAKNYALLIGNGNYSKRPLKNSINDATDFGRVLKEIGFEVLVLTDQNKEAMEQSIRDFGARLMNNDGIGLFYFSGHGVQIDGENYLVPIGPQFETKEDMIKNFVSANLVLRYMEDSKNRVNIVVLDACRVNPFVKTRSLKSRGLAPMDAPSGSLIAFSTAPGTVSYEIEGDRNGLYTKHLMANVKIPGLTVEQVFKRTREAVEIESERVANERQSPREESSLKGADVYFVPPPSGQGGVDAAEVELAYWNSIANSENSADFESYLSQYPNGKFAALAKNRLETIRSRQTVVAHFDTIASGPTHIPSYIPASARRGGVVVSSPGSFSFSDEEEASVKAAEFLSIGCRDQLRNKRVLLQLADNSGRGDVLRRSLLAKLTSVGLRQTTEKANADFVVRGKIESKQGINRMLGINEVDLTADFTLLLKNGNAASSTSVYGSSYAGSNRQQAVQALWDEKGEEVVGRLFGDYCDLL